MYSNINSSIKLLSASNISSGVSRISFRGVQNFSGKVGVFAWQSHAFVRGVRGHVPPRKFFKMVQFGAF